MICVHIFLKIDQQSVSLPNRVHGTSARAAHTMRAVIVVDNPSCILTGIHPALWETIFCLEDVGGRVMKTIRGVSHDSWLNCRCVSVLNDFGDSERSWTQPKTLLSIGIRSVLSIFLSIIFIVCNIYIIAFMIHLVR